MATIAEHLLGRTWPEPRPPEPPPAAPVPAWAVQEAKALRAGGASVQAISNKLGIPEAAVRRALRMRRAAAGRGSVGLKARVFKP